MLSCPAPPAFRMQVPGCEVLQRGLLPCALASPQARVPAPECRCGCCTVLASPVGGAPPNGSSCCFGMMLTSEGSCPVVCKFLRRSRRMKMNNLSMHAVVTCIECMSSARGWTEPSLCTAPVTPALAGWAFGVVAHQLLLLGSRTMYRLRIQLIQGRLDNLRGGARTRTEFLHPAGVGLAAETPGKNGGLQAVNCGWG